MPARGIARSPRVSPRCALPARANSISPRKQTSIGRRSLRPLRASSEVPAPKVDPAPEPETKEVEATTAAEEPAEQLEKDWKAIAQYVLATATQFFLIRLVLRGLQYVTTTGPLSQDVIPTVVVSVFFLFMALKSRVFSPIDNSRPKRSEEESKAKSGQRPSWMPPPIVFPIVWSSIAILRCVSSVLIWKACGNDLLAAPLGWFLLHLCIGDTWNTINNVEERRGTSAAFVLLVLASVYNAVYQYYQVSTTAGLVLAPSAVWLSIATVLIWTIWSINGKEPFFPMKKAKQT